MHPSVAAKAAWQQPLNHKIKPRGESATRHGSTIRVLWVHGAGDAPLLEEPAASGMQLRRVTWPVGQEQTAAYLEAGCDVVVALLAQADGVERLLEELRGREPAPPLVLVAGGLDPARELALLRAGCAEVLDPGRGRLLAQVVQRVHAAAQEREELTRARDELRRSAQRFDAVFAHAPTAVLVARADDLRVLEANPMALRMFDVDASIMGSLPLSNWVEPADRQAFREAVQRVLLRREDRVRVELRLRRSDQSLFWGDMSLACLDGEPGRTPSLIVNLLNITWHKQAEVAAADMQAELERRVREKTADLLAQRRRLEALYAISSLVGGAQSLPQLASGFVAELRRLAGADAAVLRSGATGDPAEVLAADGLAPEESAWLVASEPPDIERGLCVLRLDSAAGEGPGKRGGGAWAPACLVRVPVAVQRRMFGVVDLAYGDAAQVPDGDDLPLLEAAVGHLAAGLEALRGSALERDAAVTQERSLLARELHDSIAQALAFMNIQLELLRTALRADDPGRVASALDELEAGLRESTEDVRELLLHFRTRSSAEDIAPAIRSTVQKFELQCAVPVRLELDTRGRALGADVQVQLLHILQEALSNVRKHAHASSVAVSVAAAPHWRIEVSDDGVGFDMEALALRSRAHVGLQIMRERAAQIGASVQVESRPGDGTTVVVELTQGAGWAFAGMGAGEDDGLRQ